MASVSALLAVVLAVLVLPSSARCRPRAPVPAPAPAPAPAPGPSPPASGVRCSDCPAYCAGAAKGVCSRYCDRQPPSCDDCRSAVLQGCTACCSTGGGCSTGAAGGDCGTCDYCGGADGCGGVVESRCQGACTVNLRACEDCRAAEERRCSAYCNSNCVQSN